MPHDPEGITHRPTLSATAARLMIDAAVAEARTSSLAVTVVTVDESGVLTALLRMDGAPLVSVQTAINKAFARPTRE
jgi:glc operon protein GlcG